MRMEFTPWRNLTAEYNLSAKVGYLRAVGRTAEAKLVAGMQSSNKGRTYRKKGGRIHRASGPGDFPAVDTGALKNSRRMSVTQTEATIGTTAKHARYMLGTRRIKKRKMSKEALQMATAIESKKLWQFARLRHV
jgi:hypothetical protein